MTNHTLGINRSTISINGTNSTEPAPVNVPLVALSGALMWLAVFATLFGNLLVIISILTRRKLRKQLTNKYIMSLACADLLVGALVMIPSAIKNNHWPAPGDFFSTPFCKFWVTMDLFCCTASIYNLIGVSFDRFYACYYPIKYASEWTNRGMIVNLIIAFSWAMGFMVALPMHMDKPGFSNWANLLTHYCAPPIDDQSIGFIKYSAILAFIIPSIILFGLHSAIFVKMRSFQKRRLGHAKKGLEIQKSFDRSSSKRGSTKSRKLSEIGSQASTASFLSNGTTNTSDDHDSNTNSTLDASDMKELGGQDVDNLFDKIFHKKNKNLTSAEKKVKREEKNQRRITTMMTIIIGTFVVCWTPFALMYMIFPYYFNSVDFVFYTNPWLSEVVTWIAYTNSWLNPIIYTMMNKSIREGIFRVLKCGRE